VFGSLVAACSHRQTAGQSCEPAACARSDSGNCESPMPQFRPHWTILGQRAPRVRRALGRLLPQEPRSRLEATSSTSIKNALLGAFITIESKRSFARATQSSIGLRRVLWGVALTVCTTNNLPAHGAAARAKVASMRSPRPAKGRHSTPSADPPLIGARRNANECAARSKQCADSHRYAQAMKAVAVQFPSDSMCQTCTPKG